MTILYLNKKNIFKSKRFKNGKKLNNFIKKKGITHFYIDGFWVVRQEEIMGKSKREKLMSQLIDLSECYILLVRFLVHIHKFIETSPILDKLSLIIDELYEEIKK